LLIFEQGWLRGSRGWDIRREANPHTKAALRFDSMNR